MDYFDFPALPLLVQELITNEIVHNHPPDTWLNFALCSKSTIELVRRARPKKILDYFSSYGFNGSTFDCVFDSIACEKTTEELIIILKKCDVKLLDLGDTSFFSVYNDGLEQLRELIHALSESSRFATDLYFNHCEGQKLFFDFYQNLKNLEKLTFAHKCTMMEDLPHFPPEIHYLSHGFANWCFSFLTVMAEKSQHQPIKRLDIEDFVELEDLQTFLQTAKFMTDAEIYCQIKLGNGKLRIFMTFIDEDLFEIEIFLFQMILINLNQAKNKCALSTKTYYVKNCFYHSLTERFNVTTASSPTQSIFSDIFSGDFKEYNVENINENDWIKVSFENTKFCVHYSNGLLNAWFPRNEYETPLERINKINDILSCKKTLMKPKLLKETIDNFWENIDPKLKQECFDLDSSSDSNSDSSSDSDSSTSDLDASSDSNEELNDF